MMPQMLEVKPWPDGTKLWASSGYLVAIGA